MKRRSWAKTQAYVVVSVIVSIIKGMEAKLSRHFIKEQVYFWSSNGIVIIGQGSVFGVFNSICFVGFSSM